MRRRDFIKVVAAWPFAAHAQPVERVRSIGVLLGVAVDDPQGKAIERSLHTLGYGEVRDARVGKFLELEIDAQSRAEVEPRIREMCDKLLANTVIEDYRFEISED